MNEFEPSPRNSPPVAQKLSHGVARGIIHDVFAAGWRAGMFVSTERDLLERYRVSRATLREAIRLLEAHGMVRMRQGIGLEVASSARDSVIATLARFIRTVGATADEIADAYSLIAGHVGASTSQIELCMLVPGLKHILRDPAEVQRLRQWYHGLTASLTNAAQSPLLALFLDVLRDAANYGEAIDSTSERKLAQITASRIQKDIETVTLDARLGTEADFAGNYGVSRVTLREALSLLEIGGTLVRRRGMGGGLFKGEPDSSLTVEMAVSYLRFLHPASEDLAHARLAIEPALAAITSQFITVAQKKALNDLLAGKSEIALGQDDSQRQFHILLADFNENRVLALFVRVLMSSWSDPAPQRLGKDFRDEIHLSHLSICRAMDHGSAVEAFAAMVVHLEFADRSMRAGKISV